LISGIGRRSYLPLFLAALVPIVLFAAAVVIVTALRERDALEATAQAKVREIAADIDQYLAAQIKAAEILAQVVSLPEGDLRRFYDVASRVRDNQSGWNNIVVLDRSGEQIINLASPFGTALPAVTDVASYQAILSSRASLVGNLVEQDTVSGKKFIPIRVPMLESGELKYVVTVDLDPAELNPLFKLADAPGDWVGAIVDRNGRLVGRSTLADQYVGQFATTAALEAVKTGKQGVYEGRTLEGLDTVFSFYTSPLTGWSVHYAVPQSIYHAPLQRMIWIIFLGGMLAVLVAVLLFSILAREAIRLGVADQEKADILERSEARLRSVFETSNQYQVFLTPEGILLDANAISLAGIRRPLEEVVGKPFWETPWFTATPGLSEQVKAAIPAVAAGETVRQEIEVNLPIGVRAFDFALRPVLNAAGTVIAIMPEAMEITERREAEAKLRQSQKMEAIGQLTGGIAHDFNNMLAIVIGSINLFKRRAARGETDLNRFLDSALDGAERAATLTRRLLAFSRQQPLSPQAIEANKLVSSIAELLQRTLGENVRLETVLAGGLWMTRADGGELENALLNLAINGRDAMHDGGNLTIETANWFLDEEYCLHNGGVTPGQYVLIAVTDTGSGMAPEVLQRAFDPFFTTKPVGQGTGLGLSQVFGFVRQSGGHVKIYSEVGVGTTVKIYLPRFYGVGEFSKTGAELLAEVPTGSPDEVILLAEDDAHLRDLTASLVQELGYTVFATEHAAAALQVLDSHPEVTLLFTDIVMPGSNGRLLAEEALRRNPELKILYTTGYTKNAVVHNGILDPGVDLIVKPYTTDDLARKLRTVLDRKTPAHEEP
jgi:signal transduction histidine kinase/ActR/RegA family two-component response regulator